MTAERDVTWMSQALAAAEEAIDNGDVPVGAIIVHKGAVIASSANRTVRDQDPTAHAELIVIREAALALGNWRLEGCTLYVTLEPCAMCAGAIVLSRLDRVVFGAFDDKAGMAGSVGDLLRNPKLNHRPEVLAGVGGLESAALLREFFPGKR